MMAETMYGANGLGLAAPQVGENLRLAVMDIAHRNGPSELIVMVNPQIVNSEGKMMSEEGCLSFPELYVEIPRSEKVVVQALDRKGEEWEWEAEGIAAIALQHEIDHLDGRLVIDYLSRLKRNAALKRWREAMAEKQD